MLPQMLVHLETSEELALSLAAGANNADSLDWGTVALYTCSASCVAAEGEPSAYVEEFCWHQQV